MVPAEREQRPARDDAPGAVFTLRVRDGRNEFRFECDTIPGDGRDATIRAFRNGRRLNSRTTRYDQRRALALLVYVTQHAYALGYGSGSGG